MGIVTMNRIIVYFLITLLSTGCDTFTIIDDNPENESQPDVSNNANTKFNDNIDDNDQYYLQIAKDLYVAKQYKQAYQIASKLAEKGNHEAEYLLGYLVYYGQGVPADVDEGTRWIQKSADAGYRPAIEGLVMIRHGLTPDNKCDTDNKKSKSASDTAEDYKQIIITPDGQKEYTEKPVKK